ncbi:MAG: Crp/Fnr family transcriptional regulator [Pseudomonadota bacterium]
MTTATDSPLAPMLKKLNARETLNAADQAAVLALPYSLRTIPAHGYIVREGDVATHSCLLRSGFAYRQKTLRDGRRQICSIHLSGDMVDLQNSLLRVADHGVQALSDIAVAYIPREAVLEVAFTHRAVGEAMWYDTLIDAAIFREWMANIGQRSAVVRLAHLLCEFGLRFEAAGLGERDSFTLPMSQEQLGDCTGLTSVHVNRMLRVLRERGLVAITKGAVRIVDWAQLARAGDFTRGYLHLPAEQRAAAD